MPPVDVGGTPGLKLGFGTALAVAPYQCVSQGLTNAERCRPSRRANQVPLPPLFASFSFFPCFDYLPNIPKSKSTLFWCKTITPYPIATDPTEKFVPKLAKREENGIYSGESNKCQGEDLLGKPEELRVPGMEEFLELTYQSQRTAAE
ncbi:hypothetical protein WISP_117315 [Willisornis vidua]|uniref:Uncharacterized protein n=1 Tax=Willisornis vidua TaxID=1566151 RepID=A0ABQ9CTI9_9PASS|nr:hypothetical protein WISP_117315 [Willisornis vidua]